MTTEQAWLVAVGALALVSVVVAALAWRTARQAVARAEALVAPSSEGHPTGHHRPADPVTGPASYVITGIDDRSEPTGATGPDLPLSVERIDGRLFTDIVARETVVRAAAWSHGLRRALSAESRNRIAFQVRQQAKQQRRDRRAEAREALREYRARHRAGDAA